MTERLHSDSDPYWLLAQLWRLRLQNSWLADNYNWEDHCAHGRLHAHDGSSVQGKYCSFTGCLLLLVAMQQAVWTGKSELQLAPVAKPSSFISDFPSRSEACFCSRLNHVHPAFDRDDRNGRVSFVLPISPRSNHANTRCRRRRGKPKTKLRLWGHTVDNRGVSRGS